MYPVILVEYLTLPKLKSCIGFTVLCHGLAVASTFPAVGKDISKFLLAIFLLMLKRLYQSSLKIFSCCCLQVTCFR